MKAIHRFKPSVSKRNLLLVAGLAWTIAGGILTFRGTAFLAGHGTHLFLRLAGSAILGTAFYFLVFGKISEKHIRRIRGINLPYPCAFSFFDFRGYLLMAAMIAGGIAMRRLEIIEPAWLHTFYIVMGIPLLISAGKFYTRWATGKEVE